MTTRQKLEIIKNILLISQTTLAERLGVSFAAFNSWWTGKSTPRQKKRAAIEDLYLEVTGQRVIPADRLASKKLDLQKKSTAHKRIIATILHNPDIRDQFILKLTYNSNSIEGSTLTEPDTAAILFDDVVLSDKSLTEHLEAKNHQAALVYLFDHVLNKRPLDERFILKLHGMLMNGIRPDAGLYRRHAVRIVGANVPTSNYLRIPDLMPKVMKNADNAITDGDIFGQLAEVHARFEQIHPFSDGNGRIGRLLMCAMMLKVNMAPTVILQRRKHLYYTYLQKAQTQGDHSQLEDFLLDATDVGYAILKREDVP